MYRNILLPSGYNEFISICVSYISCPSLVLMSRYILADGQKENNNGFRFVFLPPLSSPAQYCSLKGDFFQLAGVELHHPVLRSPRYSPVSTVGAEVSLTDWLTLSHVFSDSSLHFFLQPRVGFDQNLESMLKSFPDIRQAIITSDGQMMQGDKLKTNSFIELFSPGGTSLSDLKLLRPCCQL